MLLSKINILEIINRLSCEKIDEEIHALEYYILLNVIIRNIERNEIPNSNTAYYHTLTRQHE
jgi:hypothetical protein